MTGPDVSSEPMTSKNGPERIVHQLLVRYQNNNYSSAYQARSLNRAQIMMKFYPTFLSADASFLKEHLAPLPIKNNSGLLI